MHRLFSTRHTLHSDTHYIRTQIHSGLTWILFYSIFRSATLTFQNVRKKNFNVPSTHYTHSQTSTSAGIIFETIWLILIGNICLAMSQNIWTILTHQSKSQQKQFLMRLCPSTHDKSWHPEIWKISLSLDSGHRRGTQKNQQRKNQKVVLTEIVTQY